MGLIYDFAPRSPIDWTNMSTEIARRTQAEITGSLIKCLDAIKDYFDHFLLMNSAMDDRLPLEEYTRFIFAFLVAYKLSVEMTELPDWDVHMARKTFDLEEYLTIFIERFQSSRREVNSAEFASKGDVYSVLPEVLDSARSSYRMARAHPYAMPDRFRVHMDFGTQKAGGIATSVPLATPRSQKCPATSFWRSAAGQTHNSINMTWLTPPNEVAAGTSLSSGSAGISPNDACCPFVDTTDQEVFDATIINDEDWLKSLEAFPLTNVQSPFGQV